MKKLTIAILLLLGSFSMVSAEIGLRIGGSVEVGEFSASGTETEGSETTATRKEEALVGMTSWFVEKQLGFLPGPLARVSIGYSMSPDTLKTGTASSHKSDLGAAAGAGATPPADNSVSAEISNYEQMYVTANITDWLFVKLGSVDLDVKTTEDLDTGSTYPNTSLSGTVWGIGVHHVTDSGFFGRIEFNETSIGGTTLSATNNSDNSVKLNDVDGSTGKISFGKQF
jgi:hypothetical protein